MKNWKNKTALITGASYGIGEAFAKRLASKGANIILTARSADKLDALAAELRTQYGIDVTVIAADLADNSSPQKIFDMTEGGGRRVDLLINNAGFGSVGNFIDIPLDRQMEMIQVNVNALVRMSHLFLPKMIERRSGSVIQLASVAAFQGVPYFSIYAATKAFIMNFAEGLWGECREYGVNVMALCPGPTISNFAKVAGTTKKLNPSKIQTAEAVVDEALEGLEQKRSVVVTGRSNKIMVMAERFVSRMFVTKAAAKTYKFYSTRGN